MKDFVDLQGAGEGLTKISFTSANPSGSALTGAKAALRNLTVESNLRSIQYMGGEITNVTSIVNASGSGDFLFVGIDFGQAVRLKGVTVQINSTASSVFSPIGILFEDSSGVSIQDSRVEVNTTNQAAYGMRSVSGTLTNTSVTVKSTDNTAIGLDLTNPATLNNVTLNASGAQPIGISKNGSFINVPNEVLIKNSSIKAEGTGLTEGIVSTTGTMEAQTSQIYAAGLTITTGGGAP